MYQLQLIKPQVASSALSPPGQATHGWRIAHRVFGVDPASSGLISLLAENTSPAILQPLEPGHSASEWITSPQVPKTSRRTGDPTKATSWPRHTELICTPQLLVRQDPSRLPSRRSPPASSQIHLTWIPVTLHTHLGQQLGIQTEGIVADQIDPGSSLPPSTSDHHPGTCHPACTLEHHAWEASPGNPLCTSLAWRSWHFCLETKHTFPIGSTSTRHPISFSTHSGPTSLLPLPWS